MTDSGLRRESAIEYFKELVDAALAHQGLTANELTAYYVVQLLAGFLQRPADQDEGPLFLRLAQALEAGGMRQRTGLKQIGVRLGILFRLPQPEAGRCRLLRQHRRLCLQRLEPFRRRHLLPRVCGACREVRWLCRRVVGGQRAIVLRVEHRPSPTLRKVAEDGQPSKRPAAGRARSRAGRVCEVQSRSIGTSAKPAAGVRPEPGAPKTSCCAALSGESEHTSTTAGHGIVHFSGQIVLTFFEPAKPRGRLRSCCFLNKRLVQCGTRALSCSISMSWMEALVGVFLLARPLRDLGCPRQVSPCATDRVGSA
jgi:hypothetical protein